MPWFLWPPLRFSSASCDIPAGFISSRAWLVLIAATLLWANLRRTGWEEVWGEPVLRGFAALARTMYYHGWPACPFMVSPPRGMPPYSDGLEWTPLVLNGIVFALALFVARVICQWCVLGGVMRIRRIFGITLLTLLLIYIGSYALLSSGGCYEPAAIGLNGVKWYGWAPRGFVDHYRWNAGQGSCTFPCMCLIYVHGMRMRTRPQDGIRSTKSSRRTSGRSTKHTAFDPCAAALKHAQSPWHTATSGIDTLTASAARVAVVIRQNHNWLPGGKGHEMKLRGIHVVALLLTSALIAPRPPSRRNPKHCPRASRSCGISPTSRAATSGTASTSTCPRRPTGRLPLVVWIHGGAW